MSEDQKTFLQKKPTLFIILAIVAACLIIYGQTIYFDFINIDDRAYIYENPAVMSGLNPRSLYWALTAFYSANWHPVTWLSHITDFSLFGLNAGGHHAINVVFHTINSILTFTVFRLFTRDLWKSALIALLFAVHPVHVESVAWVAERKDVLSTMFWLLTMFAYFKYVFSKNGAAKIKGDKQPTQNDRQNLFYILTILFFALGLMSKPMLVTLPFVLLLCDFWALERLKSVRDLKPLIIEKIPLFALTVISSIITFLAQKSFGAAVSLENLPLGTRLVNIILSYAKYIVMLFYPVNLGFWYPFEPNVNPLNVVGAIALLSVITIYCWRERMRRKYLLMGWLWFLGTLVPVIGLVQVGLQSLADRYTYVPFFGLFIMLVWGIGDLFEHFKLNAKIVLAFWTIVLMVFGTLAFRQTAHWRNSETLYTHTLSFTENNYFLMANLCLYYMNNTPAENAETRCTELLEKMPPSPDANNILGYLRTQTGKYAQAEINYKTAIQMRPDWGIPYANLSETLALQGKTEEAEKYLQRAFKVKDAAGNAEDLARSSNNLGASFLRQNRQEKAAEYFTKALELKPDFAQAAENLKKAREEK